MNEFIRLVSKNLAAFALLVLALLLGNALVYGLCFYGTATETGGADAPVRLLEELSDQVSPAGIEDAAAVRLRERGIWALWLDSQGRTLWKLDAPEQLPEHFSAQEVAVFAKGYLAGFPVFIRTAESGMLVLGYPKGSYLKLTGNYLPQSFVRALPVFALGLLGTDLAVLFLAYVGYKRRLLRETGPIVAAIERLGEGEPCALAGGGELAALAGCVNRVSRTLERQNRARAEWIRGVSHDIRTPLSLILGYAGRIAENGDAPESVRREAERIAAQGVCIRELVRDLNLTNRLEYGLEPVEKEPVRPAELLRAFGARLLDGALPEGYPLELRLEAGAESARILANPRLLDRALDNLVRNSVRHNPAGCTVLLGLRLAEGTAVLSVEDSGAGLKPEGPSLPEGSGPEEGELELAHGLGLALVRQIAGAHGGRLLLESGEAGGLRACLLLPLLTGDKTGAGPKAAGE